MHKLFEIPSITLFLCALCALLWLKNPRNLRNPWLINDLRLFKALYNYRDISTVIEESLQIRLFMQNEPNFLDALMNVSPVITTEYINNPNWTLGENEPKTNPIKANSNPIKANKMPKQTQCLSAICVADQRQKNAAAFNN